MLSQVPLWKRELSLRTQAEATEEGSRHDRLKTDAETRALYRKEEQIQGLSEPKIETGEMKSRVNKITDERNGPWGPPLHPCCRWKTEGQTYYSHTECSAEDFKVVLTPDEMSYSQQEWRGQQAMQF